jgi:hypothetical protein
MKDQVTALILAVTPLVHDGAMTTSTTSEKPEQLVLLPEPTVPLRFRLDEATRRRGLRHIAEIRAQLERQPDSRPEPRHAASDVPFHRQAA